MKRAALYVRVSTEEQARQGLSVENQIEALQDYCIDEGYAVAGLYNDAGISARKRYTRRPALLRLLEDCKNKKVDIVLFTKLDRWFRSVGDYYEVQRVLDDCKVPWRAIWEDYETETSSGVFKVNIMLSVAQSEADRTSERTKASVEFRRARGEYVGGAIPFGFKLENRKLEIDPENADCVRTMFKTYLETLSTKRAMLSAMDYGYSFSIRRVGYILKNPNYVGYYVTEDERKKILDSMARAPRGCRSDRVYIFSGLIFCAYCGHRLHGRVNYHKNKTISYKCNGSYNAAKHDEFVSISQRNLERYLLNNLDKYFEEYRMEIKKNMRPSEIKENKNKKRLLQERLSRLGDRYEIGDLSREEYLERREALQIEIDSIPDMVLPVPKPLPSSWQSNYSNLSTENRQAFWRGIIDKIIVSRETKTCPKVIFKNL